MAQSPIVDEVEAIIDAVMASERYAPKTVPMGDNPPLFDGMQPDNDGPWVSRVDVAKRLRASLVSPPKAGSGEPDAWKIYKPGKFVELTISLVAAEAAIASGYEVVPLYETRRDHIPHAGKMVANHEARGDGVRVDDLAQIIRRVDGENKLGAGALAEAILAALPPLGDGRAEIDGKDLWEAERIAGDLLTRNRQDGETIRRLIDGYAAAIRSISNPGGTE